MAITTNSIIQEKVPTETAVDWDTIYAAELPRVYNFLRYRVHDDALAQDLTATTFEKAWRARGQFQQKKAAFSTWLFTIASNVVRDHYRQQRPFADITTLEIADAQLTEQVVQQKQALAKLGKLLATLPEREQEIISLKFGAELTNRQIARVMNLSSLNIGVILFRSLRKLRTEWEDNS